MQNTKRHSDESTAAGVPNTGGPLTVMLLNAAEVGQLLGVSRNTVWALRSTGKLPAPIRLGRLTKWRRYEIEAWIKAGCPQKKF